MLVRTIWAICTCARAEGTDRGQACRISPCPVDFLQFIEKTLTTRISLRVT